MRFNNHILSDISRVDASPTAVRQANELVSELKDLKHEMKNVLVVRKSFYLFLQLIWCHLYIEVVHIYELSGLNILVSMKIADLLTTPSVPH